MQRDGFLHSVPADMFIAYVKNAEIAIEKIESHPHEFTADGSFVVMDNFVICPQFVLSLF